jgi:hypothetical protein
LAASSSWTWWNAFAPPPGTADFMNAEWQELFRFAVAEAHRLGLEINMTNGPGWCGSSGPWITPELSMQTLVATNVLVTGPVHFSTVMPAPNSHHQRRSDVFDSSVQYEDFYRDIAVLAYPATTNGSVAPEAVLNLTARMDADGKLDWDVPAGRGSFSASGMFQRDPPRGRRSRAATGWNVTS